jgi:hypothetical protein
MEQNNFVYIKENVIINYNEYELNTKCVKCFCVSNDLHETSTSELYCGQCLKYIRYKKDITIPKAIIRMVNNMDINCETCKNKVLLGKYKDHMEICEMVSIICSCETRMLRKNYVEHINVCVLNGKEIKDLDKKYVVDTLKNNRSLKEKIKEQEKQLSIIDATNKEIKLLEHALQEKKNIIKKYEYNNKTLFIMDEVVRQNRTLLRVNERYIAHMLDISKVIRSYEIDKQHPRYISFKLIFSSCSGPITGLNRATDIFYMHNESDSWSNIRCGFLEISDIYTNYMNPNKIFKQINIQCNSGGQYNELIFKKDIYILNIGLHHNSSYHSGDQHVNMVNVFYVLHKKLNELSDAYNIDDEFNIKMIAKNIYCDC